jgi:acyl dehydratase
MNRPDAVVRPVFFSKHMNTTLDALPALAGQEVGVSPWLVVDQQRIDAFAAATEDRQWIHVHPERATRESPYQATIAHGFLTLALISHLHAQAVTIEGCKRVINYGLNRVRFPAPVRAGDAIRCRSTLQACERIGDAWQVTWLITVEMQGQTKPALVAEWLVRMYRA